MTPGVHRVRKQSWRVAVRSAEQAFAARARLRSAVEHELRQAFERAFDKAAPDEAIVRIPKLELRLRVASLDALPDALAEAIEREMRLQPPTPPREAAVDRLQVLLGYLDTGTLTWHAAHAESKAVVTDLRTVLLAELQRVAQRGPAGAASFEQAVRFYFRLLELLPEDKWPQFAALVSPWVPEPLEASAASIDIVVALRKGIHVSAETLPYELRSLDQAPQAAITALAALRPSFRHPAHRLAALVLAAARRPERMPPMHPLAAPAVERSADSTAAVAPSSVRQSPTAQSAIAQASIAQSSIPRSSIGQSSISHFAIAQSRRTTAAADIREPGHEAPPAPLAPLSIERPAESQAVALMAGNAGLVLLHPFLLRLFRACRIYRPPHPMRLEQAAALLHWLATGREEIYEFELGLVKLLLGLRPESPLAVGEGLLGAREREEGEALLAAAIGHWKALGNTSIDGLRVSFLLRRGALREEEMGWRLQLEPESFDVLLGHLPWGFATVKLPWMTRPLYTDWPTP